MRSSTDLSDGVTLALGATALLALAASGRRRGSRGRWREAEHRRRVERIGRDPGRAKRVDRVLSAATSMTVASWCEAEDRLWEMSDSELSAFEDKVLP